MGIRKTKKGATLSAVVDTETLNAVLEIQAEVNKHVGEEDGQWAVSPILAHLIGRGIGAYRQDPSFGLGCLLARLKLEKSQKRTRQRRLYKVS